MRLNSIRVGEKYITNQGCTATIFEYFRWDNCSVIFEDGNILKNVRYADLKKGSIKNPFHLSVCGIGYLGIGNYSSAINHRHWYSMLNRCYNLTLHKERPTYKECSVSKKWECFQNFAEWHEENYNPKIMEGWALDKDILLKGNKIYSLETCCFVPQEINALFIKHQNARGKYPIGVIKKGNKYEARVNKNGYRESQGLFDTPEEAFQAYKIEKERYIKEMADKWRPYIIKACYEAMYNYVVEITD